MEILLLAITVVSLVIALFLGFAAWGMWREERARSAARVAALSAAAAAEESRVPPQERSAPYEQSDSYKRSEFQERSDSYQNNEAAKPAPWNTPPNWRKLPKPEPRHVSAIAPTEVGDKFLGSAVTAPPSGSRQRGLAIAAIVLFAALLTGSYFIAYGGDAGEVNAASRTSATAAPLELISLRHERQNGALAITGLVRNPTGGQGVERLSAVVFLFNQQGELLTSSRAGVDFTQLGPGDESPFVVRVDAPSHVARYRVSFRTDAGVVPHIDRRDESPVARDMP